MAYKRVCRAPCDRSVDVGDGRMFFVGAEGSIGTPNFRSRTFYLDDGGGPVTIGPVATFETRYHADEEIVAESPAVHLAARVLLQHAEDGEALAVLRRVAEDPLCAGSLRTVIVGGLGELRVAAAGRSAR